MGLPHQCVVGSAFHSALVLPKTMRMSCAEVQNFKQNMTDLIVSESGASNAYDE